LEISATLCTREPDFLTELPENPGIILAYLIEHVATLICNEYLRDMPVESIIWVKHKPGRPGRDKSPPEESYDQGLFVWNGETFNSPRWVSLPSAYFGDGIFTAFPERSKRLSLHYS